MATPNPLFWAALTDLILTESDAPETRPGFAELRQSIRDHRQNLVPIFVVRSPDRPGKFLVYDGHGRVRALSLEGMEKVLAIELPGPLERAELLELTAASNVIRRLMPPEELAAKVEEYIDLKECSQEEAARKFGISPGHLSRSLTSLLMPEKHRNAARQLVPSVRMMIAALRDSALQDRAMEFATTRDRNGKLPTRDAIELLLKQAKGEGSREKKQKRAIELRPKEAGPVAALSLRHDASPDAVADQLRVLAAQFVKHREHDTQVIAAILGDRKRQSG